MPQTTTHHENEKELIHFFSTFFPKLVKNNNFNGVVLFANRNSVLYLKSFGLGHYRDEYDKHFKTIHIIGDYKKIINTQLSFEPGTKGQYSNTGFILLGAMIEKITGESYYGYVEKNIFEPLLMNDTKFFDSLSSGIAVGYFVDRDDNNILKDNLHLLGMHGSSAGGCYSTATDILRFMRAIDENRIVDPNTLKFLLTPNQLFKNYGYGFQVKDNWFGHWGGFTGIEAFIMHYPHSGHTIIVFSNYYDSSLPFLRKLKNVNKKLGSN